MKLLNGISTVFLIWFINSYGYAQKDSSLISFHSQSTTISQYHPKFKSPYEGVNSFVSDEKIASSLTNTLFFAIRPWKSGIIIINPEVAGGVGLSSTTGMAGFPNGEIFRVGNPKPTIYLARLLFEERMPLHHTESVYVEDNPNLVRGFYPTDFISFYGGRFCLADKFDGNPYNHDPRSQFMNWSFMSAGAWDYAADTRGYTWGIGSEWKNKNWRAALAFTLEPAVANSLNFDTHINNAFATQFEITHFHLLKGNPGQLQLTAFLNKAHMGNYDLAVKNNVTDPDITTTANYKNHKWGWVINGSQQFNKYWGGFARISWNDGKNETWAYTEIDRSVNLGVQYSKNNPDHSNVLGMGVVINGISKPHRNYLASGGYGFIIGDGQLNYGSEVITEIYYRFSFFGDHLQVSPDYQFAINPAYNKDRGPIHIFALRTHIEL
ncbi:MAG: carbohydrate porin [Flavisolibacter sp.]